LAGRRARGFRGGGDLADGEDDGCAEENGDAEPDVDDELNGDDEPTIANAERFGGPGLLADQSMSVLEWHMSGEKIR
jgi:hypothetical protein